MFLSFSLFLYITGHLNIYRLSIGNFLPFMDRSYIIYILIYIIFHFKHDVLITEKPLRGVFNKVLPYLTLKIILWYIYPGLYIRAGSRRSSPASLPGFASYFHCFTSKDVSRR